MWGDTKEEMNENLKTYVWFKTNIYDKKYENSSFSLWMKRYHDCMNETWLYEQTE